MYILFRLYLERLYFEFVPKKFKLYMSGKVVHAEEPNVAKKLV